MSKKKGTGNRRRGRRRRRKATQAIQFRPNLREADPALLQDIRQAFPAGQMPDPEAMTEMVVMSYELAEEPELRGLLANPILSSALFVGFAEKMGIRPDDLLDDEESDSWWQLMGEVTPALLREDEEFLPDVVEALSQMRPRLKRRGRHYAAGQAAMLKLLLESGDEAGWRAAGLLQVLVMRSVQTGFAMDELQDNMGDALRALDSEAVNVDLDEARMGELMTGAERLIERDPTLRAYAERKLDKIWKEGFEALTGRELELELFSPQEVGAAVERIREHVWVDRENDTLDFEMKALLESLRPYVDELMTPQRTSQLRRQLETYRGQKKYKKWNQFLTILVTELETSTTEGPNPRVSTFVLVALLMESLEAYVDTLEEEE